MFWVFPVACIPFMKTSPWNPFFAYLYFLLFSKKISPQRKTPYRHQHDVAKSHCIRHGSRAFYGFLFGHSPGFMRSSGVFLFTGLSIFASGQGSDVLFSVRGGIYSQSFDLHLFCENTHAQIFYTLDGSAPGSRSRQYTAPLKIQSDHVIRARTYVDGKPGKTFTNSYFLTRKYTMPVLSVATNPANLWSDDRGIYVQGQKADSTYPHRGANFWKDWERVANVEYYEPDNTLGFNQQAGVKIFGGWSRPLPQKSMALFARKKYGNRYFKHAVFPDKKGLEKHKALVLRNSGSDFNIAHFRDAFMTSLLRNENLELQAYQPVVVYINGKYWGIQNIREKINGSYLAFNCNANPDSIDLLKHRSHVKVGSDQHYQRLLAYLRTHSLRNADRYAYIQTQMDVANYALYNIAEIYFDNQDAGGNIRFWRPREPGGRWRWILFDTDFGFGLSNRNAYKTNTLTMFADSAGPAWPNPPWSTFMLRKLLANETFRHLYINRWCDLLNTAFHPDTVQHQLRRFYALYKEEMVFHKKRWGGKMTSWEKTHHVMDNFARYRPAHCRKHLMEYFDLKDTALLEIEINDPTLGHVQLNSIKINKKYFAGYYFSGNSIQVKAVANFDYEFIRWEGYPDASEVLTIDMNEALKLRPVFRKKKNSPFYQQVIFNEVCFSQSTPQPASDWVELYNRSDSAVDISGWIFKDQNDKNHFEMPGGLSLGPGELLVVAQHTDTVKQYTSGSVRVVGSFGFGLSSRKEVLRLYDASGWPVDSVRYNVPKDKKRYRNMLLCHPDSTKAASPHWDFETKGSAGMINTKHAQALEAQERAIFVKRMFYAGASGLLCLLIGGAAFLRMRKKKRANASF